MRRGSDRRTARSRWTAGRRLSDDADLRVPLRERAPVRGDAEDRRPAGDGVPDVRGAGPARLSPDRGALQGVGLLQHRLRHVQAQARARCVGQRGRRQARREGEGQEGVRLGEGLVELWLAGRHRRLTMHSLLVGFGLGFLVALQLGPMSLFLIRSTLRGGWGVGLAVGAGIAVIDALYAAAGAAGAAPLLTIGPLRLILGLAGGAV